MTRPRRRGRQHTRRERQVIVWLLAIVALVVLWWWQIQPELLAPGNYRVMRVVDGDTLVLTNQVIVRLIGANTPETVKPESPVEPYGPEATEFTRAFVADGKAQVRLTLDGPRQDKYGRFLAHVWVGDRLLEEELLRAGLAVADTGFRYSQEMKDRFSRAEAEARSARRGIWSR